MKALALIGMNRVSVQVTPSNAWSAELAGVLGAINAVGDQEGVLALKELLAAQAISGTTLDMATSAMTMLEALWQCALQLGPSLERASKSIGRSSQRVEYEAIGSMWITPPSRDGQPLLSSLEGGRSLREYVLVIKKELDVLKHDVALLMNAHASFQAARNGAVRAGLSDAERAGLEKRGITDPLGAAGALTRLETVFLRTEGIKHEALAEVAAAHKWMDHLNALSASASTAHPWSHRVTTDMTAWLNCIQDGPLAGRRWPAVITGLLAWSSLARRVETRLLQEGREQ